MDSGAPSIHSRFTEALEELTSQLRQDRSILAAILCGSLSHDTVWAKSDIDLTLVTIDDKKVESSSLSINANGINVHALLMPRAEFRRIVESAIRNSFFHSFLAKGRLLYTHDESIAALCGKLNEMGSRDKEMQLLSSATSALAPLDKAQKWFLTRQDLDYTALWILYAATPLARIEIISAGLLTDREVIPQALKLNPDFFRVIYSNLLNSKKTRKLVQSALEAATGYLAERAPTLFRPLLDYLRELGDTRSATEIDTFCKRNWNLDGMSIACEYLADQGLIAKVSAPAKLTKKSSTMVQELAFVHLGDPPHDF